MTTTNHVPIPDHDELDRRLRQVELAYYDAFDELQALKTALVGFQDQMSDLTLETRPRARKTTTQSRAGKRPSRGSGSGLGA